MKNYRIKEILNDRNSHIKDLKIDICCPFFDEDYKKVLMNEITEIDTIHGMLSHNDFSNLLLRSKIVVSIPISDSSPRSVYEAIFSGAIAIISDNQYFNSLPECMKRRVIVINYKPGWLKESINKANDLIDLEYMPSEEAIEMFDQHKSFSRVIAHLKN